MNNQLSSIYALAHLTRFSDALSVLCATLIGALVAGVFDIHAITLVAATMVALFAGSVAFNDYTDQTEDRVNAPHRPLVKGELTAVFARNLGLALLTFGTLCACFINLEMAFASALTATLSIFYSLKLKGVPVVGNLIVAAVSAFSFACWMLIVQVSTAFSFVAIALVLVRLGGEFIKTAHDVNGDATAGRITVATWLGPIATNYLGLGTMFTGLCWVAAIAWFAPTSILFLPIQLTCAALLMFGVTMAHRLSMRGKLITIERTVTATFMFAVLVGLVPALSL